MRVYNKAMDDDQLTRLLKYMTERFDSLDQKLDRKADKADVERLEKKCGEKRFILLQR